MNYADATNDDNAYTANLAFGFVGESNNDVLTAAV